MDLNPAQEKFFHYITEKVEQKDLGAAKELLEESFAKQADGTFSADYMAQFMQKILPMIKLEYQEEVKQTMNNFRAQEL